MFDGEEMDETSRELVLFGGDDSIAEKNQMHERVDLSGEERRGHLCRGYTSM